MREMNPRELIAAAQSLTGITEDALARKLGMPVKRMLAWSEAAPQEDPRALAALRSFYEGAQASTQQDPTNARVQSPEGPTGVVCADALDYLKSLPTACVDLVVSDIPYGIGQDDWDVLHDNRNAAYLGQSRAQQQAGAVFRKRRKPINGWSDADRAIPRQYYEWCMRWVPDCLRVLKPGGSIFLFAGRRLAARCVVALEDAGFNFRDMLAWRRPRAVFRAQRLSTVFRKRGQLAHAAHWQGWRVGNLRPSFEPILWAFKPYDVTIVDNVVDHGLGALNVEAFGELSGGHDNAIDCGFAPGEGGLHEAQKPVRLLRALIELASPADALVLDPFAGSGSTAVAASLSGRRYLAVEKQARYCEVAEQRLSRAEEQGVNED